MNDLTIFNSEEFGQLRTVVLDGEPWAVGKDVADILGYSNSRDAIAKHVDDEDKGVAKCDTLGGAQELTIINESGIYSLIFASKLPTAKAFKRWVTSEVLPSIRKTGSYSVPDYRAETRRLEADNKARALALRERAAKDKRVNIILTGFVKAKTAPEKLALLAAYRAEGYGNKTLDIAEQAIIDSMGSPKPRKIFDRHDAEKFQSLLDKLEQAGIRKTIHGTEYICIPTSYAREAAAVVGVPFDTFLSWVNENGRLRVGADGKRTINVRVNSGESGRRCLCLKGGEVV